MKKLIIILPILALTLFACKNRGEQTADSMVAAAKEKVEMLSADQLFELMNGEEVYTLIDVRSPLEYYPGYISGAVLLPRGSLEFQIAKAEFWETAGLYMPAKDEIVVVYCKKGARGILAAETLQKMGYKKVFALDGGFKKWELSYPDYTEKNLEALGGGSGHHDMGGGC
jgi:rhodanese-related sulfurtransferase